MEGPKGGDEVKNLRLKPFTSSTVQMSPDLDCCIELRQPDHLIDQLRWSSYIHVPRGNGFNSRSRGLDSGYIILSGSVEKSSEQ